MIHQNKSNSMGIHHAKGFHDPSTYTRYTGWSEIATNFWTPCSSLQPPQTFRDLFLSLGRSFVPREIRLAALNDAANARAGSGDEPRGHIGKGNYQAP